MEISTILIMVQEIFALIGESIGNAISGGFWQVISDILSPIIAGSV
ncbi:MAG: hypothetical protein LBS96_02195 [Oscillospiraceae bacterium]|jgi:hypothetical protein|nr:hypothetical protein [Oscillospiraceae bacterium]